MDSWTTRDTQLEAWTRLNQVALGFQAKWSLEAIRRLCPILP